MKKRYRREVEGPVCIDMRGRTPSTALRPHPGGGTEVVIMRWPIDHGAQLPHSRQRGADINNQHPTSCGRRHSLVVSEQWGGELERACHGCGQKCMVWAAGVEGLMKAQGRPAASIAAASRRLTGGCSC